MTAHDPALRVTANLLCLWGLCANAACRRAKSCKGKPDDCLARYAPLVPEAARCGVLAVAAAADYGIGDAEMRAGAGAEIAALQDWIGRVTRAGQTPPPPAGDATAAQAP